jgi:C-terminal processing protease CtpA/Prc
MILAVPVPAFRVIPLFALTILLAGAVTAPAQTAQQLDPQVIQDAIESVGVVVHREYFDPTVGMQVEAGLREGLSEGRFPNLTTAHDVAAAVTLELYALSHDKHLALVVKQPTTAGAAAESRRDDARRSNGGVQGVEILPGNVGYLNLTYFWHLDEGARAIASAMGVLSNADALIVDMRSNSGGSPEMVATVIGYLFDEPDLPLFEIVHRADPRERYATPSPALADRNGSRPVYVLTSARTLSAGEGFAFLLQERHRAEVIGELTAGAANPGQPYPVNDLFDVIVPNGEVKSAVGGGNWERTGVKPDVAALASEALQVAHARALRKLIDAAPQGAGRERLQRELATVEAIR